MKPEVLASLGIQLKKMMKLDIKKKCYHLPLSSVYVGVKAKELIASAPESQYVKIKSLRDNIMKLYVTCLEALQKKMHIDDLPRHSRGNVVPTTMPVIKRRDTNEDCAETFASTENKLAEDANTSFIEEKFVKDRSPPKQGVKRLNGDLLPTEAIQIKKKKKKNHFFDN
ncbi:hypothetical protein AVEN_31650-1 [Araneus ventricosus]|uniref:Uncharacterized protein n=1 Tax=Araneus ventricosus TaxID=182803 RepID=A0A4Y2JKR4_ARAVE|nr:hypothetical protein AVEN_35181-1 [Araneus ventricosus]GBM90951.1 hypothetical protein AVEN_31650-1 [Araneus ventricosus]